MLADTYIDGRPSSATSMEDPIHVLMVAFEPSGHFGPFLQLLYNLSEPPYSQRHVKMTVITGSGRMKQLTALQERGDFKGLELTIEEQASFPHDPSISLEPPRPSVFVKFLQETFQPFTKRLLEEKNSPNSPTCIVGDMFFIWLQDIADELGVPWYPIVPAASWYTLCGIVGPNLLKTGTPEQQMKIIPELPWAQVFDFPCDVLRDADFFSQKIEKFSKAAAILFNTTVDIDEPTGALQSCGDKLKAIARARNSKGPNIYPIGPMVLIPGFSKLPEEIAPTRAACLQWLDSNNFPASSVLYVCFGSAADVSSTAKAELAHGLDASGVPFLWVTKASKAELEAVLPPGYQAKIKGRGFIETGWAPQPEILMHSSIGGYLSHCGWNSVMEGLCCGLPFITWPLGADQTINAAYLRNALKAGVGVPNILGSDYSRVSRDDIAIAVKLLMHEQQGKECREVAMRMKTSVKTAASDSGSSHQALHRFLSEITTPKSSTV